MQNLIKKAVFPVAGLGTRFLPATKATPKEMLPIIDKPLIQYAVEEAIAAGISELIFITGSSKHTIEDHFDTNYGLEYILSSREQLKLLGMIQNILPPHVSCAYTHQPKPLGLGHAVLCAKNLIENQPFAVLLADNLIDEAPHGCLKNMISIFENVSCSIVAIERVSATNISLYGIVALAEQENGYTAINSIVEKPEPSQAPSNLAVIGRYILTPRIFSCLEQTTIDSRGEMQLTDAISKLLKEEPVFSYLMQGQHYDCGNKFGYLQAIVNYGLKHPTLGNQFNDYLINLIQNIGK